ncbi:MAG: hypothetical protein PHF84_09290, partial [bacterium]|nr:hypothetical protein [bacterium]
KGTNSGMVTIPTGLPVNGNTNRIKSLANSIPVVEYIRITDTAGGYQRGDIQVKVRVNDQDNDNIKYMFYFQSPAAGIEWQGATVREEIENRTQGIEYVFTWDSIKDLGEKVLNDVKLKIKPYDYKDVGEEKEIDLAVSVNNVQLSGSGDVRVDNSFRNMDQTGSVTVMFEAQKAGEVTCTVYNRIGRRIREIKKQVLPGFNTCIWDYKDKDGKKVSSEVYVLWVKGAGIDKYIKISLYR